LRTKRAPAFTRLWRSHRNYCAASFLYEYLSRRESAANEKAFPAGLGGAPLSAEAIEADDQAYAAHLAGDIMQSECPGPQHPIVGVYGSSGPPLGYGAPQPCFDA
jgi:hypothetical protein